jgi:LPXTG-motif cell wall-anchored protein
VSIGDCGFDDDDLYCCFSHKVLYCRFMDANTTVKLIAGVLALVLVAIIILRRKKKKADTDDDF